MSPEFTGIEKRLDELHERLARLELLRNRPRSEDELARFGECVREWMLRKVNKELNKGQA